DAPRDPGGPPGRRVVRYRARPPVPRVPAGDLQAPARARARRPARAPAPGPPEKVFKAWSQTEALKSWSAPGDMTTPLSRGRLAGRRPLPDSPAGARRHPASRDRYLSGG